MSTPEGSVPLKVTVPAVRSARAEGRRLVMVTAYDAPSGRFADAAGVDIVLVGDSLGMTALGRPDTLSVTLAEMVHHTAATRRGVTRALLIADMPFLTFHTGARDAVRAAGRLVARGGAAGVKIEGGRKRVDTVRALLDAEIPVMGHIGLTPQSTHALGGYRVQGRDADDAEALIEDGAALAAAGVFALVLEGVPDRVAAAITAAVDVPTIGIGAGPACDGQVLVFHDLLGMSVGPEPRFVRRYAEIGRDVIAAIAAFAADVRTGAYPTAAESYPTPEPVRRRLAARTPRERGRRA